MEKKQHYMKREERITLEAYLRAGKGVSWIAREMGFSRQAIYNEISVGTYEHDCGWKTERRYSSDKAQKVHEMNQTAKGRQLAIGNNHQLARRLEQLMMGVQPDGKIDKRRRYSPAAAMQQARAEGLEVTFCLNTLYNYIDKRVFARMTVKDRLNPPGKKPKERQESRNVHPNLPNIEKRPEEIMQRKIYGHWEMDLIVSPKGNAALIVLVERKTRKVLMTRIPDKKAATIRAVFDRLEKTMGKKRFRETFKSITTDNGPEFLEYDLLVKSIYGGERFKVYYCHSYSAWEKGSVENANRLIRRWFPKGTEFNEVQDKDVKTAQEWLNLYPRKILGWKTAAT